jgi:hypothetical protein
MPDLSGQQGTPTKSRKSRLPLLSGGNGSGDEFYFFSVITGTFWVVKPPDIPFSLLTFLSYHKENLGENAFMLRAKKSDNQGVYFASYVAMIGMAASTDAVKPRRRLTFPHKLFLRFLLSHFSIGAKVHGYYRLAGVTRESFFVQKKSADLLTSANETHSGYRFLRRRFLLRRPPLLAVFTLVRFASFVSSGICGNSSQSGALRLLRCRASH